MGARRLKSYADVRRYLAQLILKAESGEIDLSLASKLGYLSNILLRTIEGSDLEKRVADLEHKIKTMR